MSERNSAAGSHTQHALAVHGRVVGRHEGARPRRSASSSRSGAMLDVMDDETYTVASPV
jgi:hypothetical protein